LELLFLLDFIDRAAYLGVIDGRPGRPRKGKGEK